MAWNLEDISKDELRADKKQEFNSRQINVARSLGENMASFGCILVVILFVGYIWTDMKIDVFTERMLCDALVSVISFIVVEDLMSRNGINCGKLYGRSGGGAAGELSGHFLCAGRGACDLCQ